MARKNTSAAIAVATPAQTLAPTDAAIVVPTPADETETAPFTNAETALIENAVAFLNDAMRKSGLELAVTVSDYVVAQFFGGDPTGLTSFDHTRTNTYGALAQREDLQMGKATLRRLVRIGVQIKELPTEVAMQLSPPQHRALLVLDDRVQKAELARIAVEEDWDAKQIAAAIAGPVPRDGPKLGRPPKPELVKQVAAAVKGMKGWAVDGGFELAFRALEPRDQAQVVTGLREIRDAMDLVLDAVSL